jgi:hypothetical protein
LFCLKRRRQHVLPWLSSHKLGRPFGLAGAALPFGISDVVNGFFLGTFVICVSHGLQCLATTYSSIA